MKFSGIKLKAAFLCHMICLAPVVAAFVPIYGKAEEAKTSCRYSLLQTLSISFDGFRPTIKGSADGKPVTMLIDSGSFETALFQHTADRLKLGLRHSDRVSVGIGGESTTHMFHAREFKIGSSQGTNVLLPVIHEYASGLDSDGLVGADFLFQNSDVEMSLVDRYLKFYGSKECEHTSLSYWDSNASMVDLKLGTSSSPQPEIEILVNGKKFRAMIDSGAPSSFIDLRAAAELGVTPQSPNVSKKKFQVSGIGEHKTDAWIARFASISIGDETIQNAKINVLDMWAGAKKDIHSANLSHWINEQPAVVLGVDFLRSHRILFSVVQKRMYFSYLGGNVFRTSDKDDLAWYKAAANRADHDAEYALALIYLHSPNVPHDSAAAFALLTKAAAQDNNNAKALLGTLYEEGIGVSKDLVQAIAWYRKSAKAGNVHGQMNLARMYESGTGIGKDQLQAASWFQKAAEQNDAEAQIKIGIFYLQGKGVPRDDAIAHDWLAKAVKGGAAENFRQLGAALFNFGMYTESAAAFQKAVEKDPTYEYSSIWLYLAQARERKKEGLTSQLESSRGKWKEVRWPSRVADFYIGQTTPDQLMKLAHDADKETDNEQTCEANFYIAEWHLINARKGDAQPLLQAAVNNCPENFREYTSAKAQLALLDAGL